MQSDPPRDDVVTPAPRTTSRKRDLNVISRQPLEAAFTLALERSLRKHAPALPAATLERVRADAFREFMSLVKNRVRKLRGVPKSEFLAELERSHNLILKKRDEASAELARLQLRAEVFRHLKEDGLVSPREDAVLDATLNQGIQQLFNRAERGELDLETLKQEVSLVATEVAHADKERSLSEYDRQIDLFQRRITKLNASLERSEETLQELARNKGVDPGVSSIYRTVQGLSPEDDLRAVKEELLVKVFEANLALREQAS